MSVCCGLSCVSLETEISRVRCDMSVGDNLLLFENQTLKKEFVTTTHR